MALGTMVQCTTSEEIQSELSETNPLLYRILVLFLSLIVVVVGWYILVKFFLIRFKIVRELLGMEKKPPIKVVVKKTPRVASLSEE